MNQWNRIASTLVLITALAGTSACVNIFKPFDSAKGDRQLLSAARAAFDRGDIGTARELYGKVSADESARSELVFVDLDSCGADIGAFGTALSQGTSVTGKMVTVMAEKMNKHGVSPACFATLLAAFKRARTIVDPSLRGFTSFMTALAIAGEVLGSNNGIAANGILDQTDIYATPATCTQAAACAGCSKADGITASGSVNLASAGTISATWGSFNGAILAATTALGPTELNIATGPSATMVAAFNAADPTTDFTYRCILASIGVGR
jgi:hypothetical protein